MSNINLDIDNEFSFEHLSGFNILKKKSKLWKINKIELYMLYLTLQELKSEKEKQEVTHQEALKDIIEKHAKEQHDLGKYTHPGSCRLGLGLGFIFHNTNLKRLLQFCWNF